MPGRLVVCAATIAFVANCSRADHSAGDGPIWSVSQEPFISVGGAGVADSADLAGVTSAARLPNGGIAVASSGSGQLFMFDSTGRFSRTVGRAGKGPGEFLALHVFAHGDSLVLYDAGQLRWTVLGADLRVAAIHDRGAALWRRPGWLYRGALVVDQILAPVPAWVFARIEKLRRSDPSYRMLIRGERDGRGVLWIRDEKAASRWTAYWDATGPGATTDLPSGFRPLQFGADFVLGVAADSVGLEQVLLYRLTRTGRLSPETGPAREVPDLEDAPLLGTLTTLMAAQEGYYATHGGYAADADSLKATPSATLFLLDGDARRWAGVVADPQTGATCGVSVGLPAPPGWIDGTPFCGR